jgi:hypothetical protein
MALFIIIRILFIASMVFIIGYVFGGFSKKTSLTLITKIAAVLIVILFIAANGLFMRSYFGHGFGYGRNHWNSCDSVQDTHVPNH